MCYQLEPVCICVTVDRGYVPQWRLWHRYLLPKGKTHGTCLMYAVCSVPWYIPSWCRSVKAKAKQNQKRPKSLRRHQQPTIIQSLASVSRQASSQSRSSLRKLSDTKTKPRNLTIDELFGMGSGWLSDTESDPPGSGESGSHSAHSPQCNASSSLSSPSGSVSVAGVASRPRNIVSPDVLLSPPSYLTPPLGEEEGDWDRDSGYRTINTGLHSPNDQRQKNQGSIKKLNSFVKCKLNSTSLTKYTVSISYKHTLTTYM